MSADGDRLAWNMIRRAAGQPWRPAPGDLVRQSTPYGLGPVSVITVVDAGMVTARVISADTGQPNQWSAPVEEARRALCQASGCRFGAVAWWYPRATGDGPLGVPEPVCQRCAQWAAGQVHWPAQGGDPQ